MPNSDQSTARRRANVDTEERRHVLAAARIVAATVGRNFFQSLVQHLADAFGADCVYLAELVHEPINRLRIIAVYPDDILPKGFTQDLPGTASYHVLIDGAVAWNANAMRIFPSDPLLESIAAETYVGIRLCDSAGQIIGLIAAVSKRRLSGASIVKSVLETFAPRAAAELERSRAEDALRESQERYRNFIAFSPDAMWRIEFDGPIPLDVPEDEQIERIFQYGYVAECNEALSRLLGARNANELVGTTFAALFSMEEARVREELRSAIRSGYAAATFSTMRVDQNGRKQYRQRTQCGIVENNHLQRIWGTTRDITDLRLAELAVETSERHFHEVLEHIQLPALMLDGDGTIRFINGNLLRLGHLTKESVTGLNWLDLISSLQERDSWSALLRQSSSESLAHHFESTLHLRDAPSRIIAWDTITLRDEEGLPAGLAAIGRDITGQKALEARLRKAEKLESIGRLAGGAAHDFNNFLHLIQAHLSLLIEETDPELPAYSTLVEVLAIAERCNALSQQLLAIGRRQQLRPELFNLNDAVREEESILRSIAGQEVQFVTDLDPSLGLVYADRDQIRRIFVNLVKNSRDAMPQGGTLTIATSNVDFHEAVVAAEVPAGQYVRLTVSDTGVGLSEDVKRHMFDPFFTTKAPGEGVGLGLLTVYGIVAQSGGCLLARSEPGEGTSFEILLPRQWKV